MPSKSLRKFATLFDTCVAANIARGYLDRRQGQLRQQLVKCDRKLSHANAGRVVSGVGDRRSRPADAEFADAFGTEWIGFVVVLVEEYRLDVRHVAIDGDMVLGEVMVDEMPVAPIHDAFFHQGRADTPDHAAN